MGNKEILFLTGYSGTRLPEREMRDAGGWLKSGSWYRRAGLACGHDGGASGQADVLGAY